MTKENVSVPMTFNEARNASMDFFNQGSLAHRIASSQEEWEVLWLDILTKHNLHEDADMRALAYVSEDDAVSPLKVIH